MDDSSCSKVSPPATGSQNHAVCCFTEAYMLRSSANITGAQHARLKFVKSIWPVTQVPHRVLPFILEKNALLSKFATTQQLITKLSYLKLKL